MSYSVEYNPELRKTYPTRKRKLQNLPIKSIAITMGIMIALYAVHTLGILRLIIPGDPAVTTGAFSTMVEDVRSGQTVSDAVFSFCRNIVTGGMQP